MAAPGKFPGPNINSCDEDVPMIKRVPMRTTEIGSRKTSLPSGAEAKSDMLSIDHVGGSAGSK